MTTTLSVGNHTIQANYSGDVNYAPATSDTPVSVQVAPATTSTTLAATTTAQGTTLTATLVVTSPGNPPIVGSVSFYDGATLLGTEPVTNGVASLNAGVLSAGTHSLSAVFTGNGNSSKSVATVTVDTNTDGPQVTSVDRYGYHIQPTYLLISFDGPLAVSPAEDITNYQIVGPGGRAIKVTAAIYDTATDTVTLVPASRLNLHWKYQLTINGSTASGLTNPDGMLLDGAGTGQPGSNYVTTLAWKNLAGKASQLPTRGLLHSGTARQPRAVKPAHNAQPRLNTAAVDHVLAKEEIHAKGGRQSAIRHGGSAIGGSLLWAATLSPPSQGGVGGLTVSNQPQCNPRDGGVTVSNQPQCNPREGGVTVSNQPQCNPREGGVTVSNQPQCNPREGGVTVSNQPQCNPRDGGGDIEQSATMQPQGGGGDSEQSATMQPQGRGG